MVTLHGYVLRELLKTFGLTLLALTVLFTMGGGLFNVVSYEGVSAADVFRFVPYLIPIVITLTMPIAALFAATMVYGRLAADNELLACRAAGVNVHRLFISVILLSIFVAAFTLLFGSFIIPGFVQRIENFARSNIRDLVAQTLQRKGFIHRGKAGEERYTLTAERVQGVAEEALRDKGFEVADGVHYLLIKNPTFLHIDDDGDLQRFSVAQWGLCVFDVRPTPIEATLLVREARDFEIGKRAVTIEQQQIGPMKVPLPTRTRLSTADLRSLFHWRSAPWDATKLRDKLRVFGAELTRERFFAYCSEHLRDGALLLTDSHDREYALRCERVNRKHRGLILSEVSLAVQPPDQTRPTRYEAAQAELVVAPFANELLVEIRLVQTAGRDVLEYNPRTGNYDVPRHKPTISLDGALIPAEVYREMERYTPAAVVDPDATLPIEGDLADKRIGLQKAARHVQRKITGTIHFRLGYTTSVLVTALMGAALGVIFRGARALAAFALAMIPFFSVMILMVLGRQLTEDQHTSPLGPLVTWGGLAAVLIADLVIMRLGVRR